MPDDIIAWVELRDLDKTERQLEMRMKRIVELLSV
jgi:hypothetical protein